MRRVRTWFGSALRFLAHVYISRLALSIATLNHPDFIMTSGHYTLTLLIPASFYAGHIETSKQSAYRIGTLLTHNEEKGHHYGSV